MLCIVPLSVNGTGRWIHNPREWNTTQSDFGTTHKSQGVQVPGECFYLLDFLCSCLPVPCWALRASSRVVSSSESWVRFVGPISQTANYRYRYRLSHSWLISTGRCIYSLQKYFFLLAIKQTVLMSLFESAKGKIYAINFT